MLNPRLDWDAIRDSYAKDGFVIISDVLDTGKAEEILQTLVNDVEWETCFLGEDGRECYTAAELKAMPPEKKRQIHNYIQKRPAREFSYFYQKHELNSTVIPALKALNQYVAGREYVNFIKYITGELEIDRVTGQASCYPCSTFLNIHDDKTDLEDRKLAYVMGFTKVWRADFGGLLHIKKADDGWEVHVPQFNCLTLFKIPREHFVSQVANYTPVARYTVNGWFVKS